MRSPRHAAPHAGFASGSGSGSGSGYGRPNHGPESSLVVLVHHHSLILGLFPRDRVWLQAARATLASATRWGDLDRMCYLPLMNDEFVLKTALLFGAGG